MPCVYVLIFSHNNTGKSILLFPLYKLEVKKFTRGKKVINGRDGIWM